MRFDPYSMGVPNSVSYAKNSENGTEKKGKLGKRFSLIKSGLLRAYYETERKSLR